MKAKIHPKYHQNVKVTCACGNAFETGSTQEKIDVEICSTCHPFYTGKQNLVDTAGRVDQFKARLTKKTDLKKKVASQRKTKSTKKPAKDKKTKKLAKMTQEALAEMVKKGRKK